jgi:hypothetical protein
LDLPFLVNRSADEGGNDHLGQSDRSPHRQQPSRIQPDHAVADQRQQVAAEPERDRGDHGGLRARADALHPTASPHDPAAPPCWSELDTLEYSRIALIEATGSGEWTNQTQMLDALRKRAGAVGANAILLPRINEPGAGAKVAGAIFGTGTQRKGNVVALRILGRKDPWSAARQRGFHRLAGRAMEPPRRRRERTARIRSITANGLADRACRGNPDRRLRLPDTSWMGCFRRGHVIASCSEPSGWSNTAGRYRD